MWCVCVVRVCGACVWCVCVARMCGACAYAYLRAPIANCMNECTCGQVRVFIYVDVYVCACIYVREISLVSSIF